MIKLENVFCVKDNHIILNNIHLVIKPGEKIAIIGPSGAGKTTLFNILSRLEYDYEGTVEIDQKPITSYHDNREFADVVGTISQGVHLIDQLKVVHNVLAGKLKDWSFLKSLFSFIKPQEKDLALEALDAVNMKNHYNKKTVTLSGGEKQRVAIARLLVQSPKVVLADEPIAALDPKLAKQSIELLLEHTKDKTMMMILHHVSFATTYFDRVVALKDGRIEFDLPASEVTSDDLGALYE